MFMIMLVLDKPELLDHVLEAWSQAGVTGCTIVESSGMYRRQVKRIPMRYSYEGSSGQENGNLTIFAVVQRQALIDACLAAAENITGDLNLPDTGIFAAWPLLVTKGVAAQD